MYIESEFALLEAQNEQLTRENKKLVEVLEWVDKAIGIFAKEDLYFAAIREQIELVLPTYEECTCLPDLPDGRSRGHCYAHNKEIYIGGE